MTATVSIIIGSDSDMNLAKKCSETLDSLSIDNTINVYSAHRTPELVAEHLKACEEGGTKVFIAMAGLAAHLAGAAAATTVKPVIGVPGDGGPLQGFDSLLSTVQMPKGVPVATVAIGSAGAVNSAILAAQIISLSSPEVEEALKKQREESVKSIEQINKNL